MATFLMGWELGGGLGHLAPLRLLIEKLRARQHRVVVASKDLTSIEQLLGDLEIGILQSPYSRGPSADQLQHERTYAHILRDHGFGNIHELKALTSAWTALFDYVRPDVFLGDHAPTGMLAARRSTARRAVIGPGFLYPPDVSPLPPMVASWSGPRDEWLRDEEQVLETANRLLADWHVPPMSRLTQLNMDASAVFLSTYPELDPYGPRERTSYFGIWPVPGGMRPEWPAGRGKRIFAYLKRMRALRPLLDTLRRSGQPTIVLTSPIDKELKAQFECETMRFASSRLNTEAVAREADLAILNANHGMTAAMLLAGKPTLHLPIFVEQALTGVAIEELGAGLSAKDLSQSHDIALKVVALLSDYDRFRSNAERVAARYQVNREEIAEGIVSRLEELAAR